ncbi:MAG: MFS transporter [Gammaproteobacteria bacterium]|nr:MFS transporter [Gammaproteobacteria bacterium]
MKNSIYGFLVWLIATLFVIYAFCLNTAASVFQESIQSSLHLSNVGVSIAMGAFIVGFACMQIPAGYLLDRFNARYVVSFGVFLLAVGNVFISYSNNIVMFSLSNLIQGMGGSFAFIAVAVLISQWFPARYFPILFGLTQTLSCILSGILHYVMAQRLAVSTWNSLYQYLAIVGVILFLLTIAFVKSPANRSISTSVSLSTSLADVCKNKQIILCMLTAATSFGILLAYASLWYLPVQKFYEVNTSDSLIISSIIFAGIGIGTPLWGYISNLAKSRIMIIHVTLVLGTMMLLAGIYLPHFESHSLIFVKIVSFLIGLLLSGSMLLYTVVSEITTDNIRGVALSVTNTGVFLMNAGMMFIPLLFLTKTSQIFFTYLWVLPCSVMFSILLLYFIQESYRVSSS